MVRFPWVRYWKWATSTSCFHSGQTKQLFAQNCELKHGKSDAEEGGLRCGQLPGPCSPRALILPLPQTLNLSPTDRPLCVNYVSTVLIRKDVVWEVRETWSEKRPALSEENPSTPAAVASLTLCGWNWATSDVRPVAPLAGHTLSFKTYIYIYIYTHCIVGASCFKVLRIVL